MAEHSSLHALESPLPEGEHWVWDTGIGRTSVYNICCLTSDTLYIRLNVCTASGMDKILTGLQCGSLPEEVLNKPTVIPLRQVLELRCSDKAAVLEVHYGAKSPAVIHGKKSPTHREIYEALRDRLAPGTRPTEGNLTPNNAIYLPSIGLGLTTLVGGVLAWWATIADPEPRNTGRRSGMKNGIELLLAKIGVLGTIGIAAAFLIAFGGWLAYRLMKPHAAEVIVIKHQE